MLALVLPGEAVALPHVGPTGATGVLARASLEAVVLAGGVGIGGRRLAEQAAEIDEVLLRRGALRQLRRPPLGDELTRCHGIERKGVSWPARRAVYLRESPTSGSSRFRTLPVVMS